MTRGFKSTKVLIYLVVFTKNVSSKQKFFWNRWLKSYT